MPKIKKGKKFTKYTKYRKSKMYKQLENGPAHVDVKGECSAIVQLGVGNGDTFNTGAIANINTLYHTINTVSN